MGHVADKTLSDYQRTRRVVLAIVITIIVAGLVFVGSSQSELVHERIESLGAMLILIGIGGRLWSTLYIGGRKSAEIVDIGPYSVMRNPLYFFSTIAAGGIGAQTGSLVLMVAFALLCWLAFSIVIQREEAYLAERMGETYRGYLARVPRFLPRPRLYRDEEEVTFRPALLKRTLFDGLAFFASVPLFELIEELQEQMVIPVLLSVF